MRDDENTNFYVDHSKTSFVASYLYGDRTAAYHLYLLRCQTKLPNCLFQHVDPPWPFWSSWWRRRRSSDRAARAAAEGAASPASSCPGIWGRWRSRAPSPLALAVRLCTLKIKKENVNTVYWRTKYIFHKENRCIRWALLKLTRPTMSNAIAGRSNVVSLETVIIIGKPVIIFLQL